MELIEDSAIVVAGRDMGESDRLMTFVTSHHGKIRAVAKGARRSKKRFLNALEPCTLIGIKAVPPRTPGHLCRLDSAEIIESYPAIRASVDNFMLASLCCELADLWVQEEDPHEDIFELLNWFLKETCLGSSGLMGTLVFKTRLLSMAGYRQEWTKCVKCGIIPQGTRINFSMKTGGCLCTTCHGDSNTTDTVSAGTLRSLAFMDRAGLTAIPRLKMGKAAMNEAWHLLAALHRYHLQRAPRSYSVMGEVIRKYLA